jgi:hypothetical protein
VSTTIEEERMSKAKHHLASTLAILAVCAVAVDSYAGCFYPKRRTTEFLGYNYSDGSSSCFVVIGPQPPLEVVGERITECDGTITQWGLVCPDYNRYVDSCDPICDYAAPQGEESTQFADTCIADSEPAGSGAEIEK